MAEIDAEVDRDLDPFRQAVSLLRTIPGVSDLAAQVIISEIGIDMGRFPTPGHLISGAGQCPRNDESAGRRRSARLRKGAAWLKTTLVQCAWAGSRKKESYFQAQFQRLQHRRGPKKAICAVAASILTAVYHMLRDGTFYQDLGADHFRRISPENQSSAPRPTDRPTRVRLHHHSSDGEYGFCLVGAVGSVEPVWAASVRNDRGWTSRAFRTPGFP